MLAIVNTIEAGPSKELPSKFWIQNSKTFYYNVDIDNFISEWLT